MSSDNKGLVSTSYSDVDPQEFQYQKHMKKLRLVDSARIGLTVFSLLCGLTVLGTSGDTLAVYNTTHLSSDFHLPLWPDQFDLRPTVALVVGSSILVIANIVSLLFSKVKVVSTTPSRNPLNALLGHANSPKASEPDFCSHVSFFRCALLWVHGCHDRHDLLLCRQRLYYKRYAAELELPMGICEHGCETALWYLMQGKPDSSLPVCHISAD